MKVSFSGDLKYQMKYEPKNYSSCRSVDTKFLFKNDQLKELSRFAFNPSSRDVSHLRDRISVPLPKIVPSLPTNIDHLKQLYYSSDPLGNPYTVSCSNLVSSLSCKKQSCVEKVLTTHNSILQDDFTTQSIERLSFGNPSGRQDIKSLQSWLKDVKTLNLEQLQSDPVTWDINLIEQAEIIYVMAGKELVRQVGVHCTERGEVLKEVLWFFSTVFKAQKAQYMKDLREKIDKINKEIEEKVYKHARQIAQYEILVQKKTEKFDLLKDENEKLNQMLKKTQISLIKLQSEKELKGGFVYGKQVSPVLHISSVEKNNLSQSQEKKTVEELGDEELVYVGNEKELAGELAAQGGSFRGRAEKAADEGKKVDEGKKFELKQIDLEGIQLVTVNEIINGEMQANEKTCQAEEEKSETLEQETQTEKVSDTKPIYKFEMRSRILAESRLKLSLHLEETTSISIFPQARLLFNPYTLEADCLKSPSPKLDSICVSKAQKTIKSYEDELLKLEESQKTAKKRASLLFIPSDLPSKSKSRLSPQMAEEQTRVRKMSQQISPLTMQEDDILINNVLLKQKAYNDLAESIRSKKSELSSITSEIENKSQKLNTMKKELQIKYLEIQAIKSPLGLQHDGLKKILVDKLEGMSGLSSLNVKLAKNGLGRDNEVTSAGGSNDVSSMNLLNQFVQIGQPNPLNPLNQVNPLNPLSQLSSLHSLNEAGSINALNAFTAAGASNDNKFGFFPSEADSTGLNELDRVISGSFDLDSWKAGYNAGFEKGLAVGFRQGEELGIEVGEDQGLIKTINELDEQSDSKSDSSSSESDKDLNEEAKQGRLGKAISEIKQRLDDQSAAKSSLSNELRSRISKMSISTVKSSATADKTLISEEPASHGKTSSVDDKAELKRSLTFKNELKRRILSKRSIDSSVKPIRASVDAAITEESAMKRNNSVSATENSVDSVPLSNRRRPKKSKANMTEKLQTKPKIEGQSSNTDEMSTPCESVNVKTGEKDRKTVRNSQIPDKTLKKQQTFVDSTSKALITITINQEANLARKDKREESLTEGNKLVIRPKRSRKNSSASKYSRSDNDEQDKILSSGGEELADYEPRKRQDTNQILRKRFREITKFNEFHFHSRSYQFVKKANPATKIIETFLKKSLEHITKRAKMSKRMSFRLLSSIYSTFPSRPKDTLLVEHLYDEFHQKYSVKSVCEKKLKEFLAALLKFSSCKRSQTFLKLTGISSKLGTRPYSAYTIPVYMQSLNFILNSKLGIVIAVDDTADQIMVPVVRAIECAKEVFEGKLEKTQVTKLVSRLEFNSLKDPKKINVAGLIENELALEIICETFEDYHKAVLEGLELVAGAVRFKEDTSVLGKGELAMMARFISPGKLREDEAEEPGFWTMDEVIAKCLDKNLLGIDEVRSFVYREEKLAGDKDMQQEVVLMIESLLKNDRKVVRGLNAEAWVGKLEVLLQGVQTRDILESFIAWRLYFNELLM